MDHPDVDQIDRPDEDADLDEAARVIYNQGASIALRAVLESIEGGASIDDVRRLCEKTLERLV